MGGSITGCSGAGINSGGGSFGPLAALEAASIVKAAAAMMMARYMGGGSIDCA
jgi:hypothetical protein